MCMPSGFKWCTLPGTLIICWSNRFTRRSRSARNLICSTLRLVKFSSKKLALFLFCFKFKSIKQVLKKERLGLMWVARLPLDRTAMRSSRNCCDVRRRFSRTRSLMKCLSRPLVDASRGVVD